MGLKTEVKKALANSRKLRFKFKREAVYCHVVYLCGMRQVGMIDFDEHTAATLATVIKSRDWAKGSDRVFTITLTGKFDLQLFRHCLEDVLKEIEAI